MMRSVLSHIVFTVIAISSVAQTDVLKKDLVIAQEAIMETLPLRIVSDYKLYATHDTTVVMSKAHAETYISEKDYYQHIEGVHTIIKGGEVAIIDEEEQTIIIDQKEIDIHELIFNIELKTIDQIVKEIHSSEDELNKIYDLKLSSYSTFSRVIIHISKKDYTINKIELYYSGSQGLEDTLQEEQSPRLVADISYRALASTKRFFTLEYNPFFKLDNKNLLTKSNYKSYSLINNLKTNE